MDKDETGARGFNREREELRRIGHRWIETGEEECAGREKSKGN